MGLLPSFKGRLGRFFSLQILYEVAESREEEAMGAYELAICGAAVVGAATTVIKLWLEIGKGRKTTRQILDHISSLRESMQKNAEAIKNLEATCNTLQKATDGRLTTSSVSAIKERRTALEEAELARKKERDEWDKLVAVAKGIGWAIDRMKDEEDD